MDVIINCLCTSHGCNGNGLIVASGADLNAWLVAAPNITDVTCPACGCIQDLGNGVTHVSQIDKAPPRIDGISPIVGVVGNTVTISGHRLNFKTLVVKF